MDEHNLSLKGPYKQLKWYPEFEVNSSGFVRLRKNKKLRMPIKRSSGRINYMLRDTNGKPVAARLDKLIGPNNVNFVKMRKMAQDANRRRGFDKRKPEAKLRNRRREYRRKPCPDGRSKECHGYLPTGYHFRCPECWRDLERTEGIGGVDFPGDITGSSVQ